MTQIETHKYDGSFNNGYHYDGLVIHAGEGVHEYVYDYIVKNFKPEIAILVLGAGTGSFDSRLFDGGYTNITSIDINIENYKYDNTRLEFIEADLNKCFAEKTQKKFDVIIAIEIIEHLFSTANFLQNCESLLNKTGSVLITSPNPRSYGSRWKYLVTGYHNGFQGVPQLYEHINPIHIDIFRHHCHFNKLKIAFIDSFNHKYVSSKLANFVKVILNTTLWLIDSFRSKGVELKNERHSILFLHIIAK